MEIFPEISEALNRTGNVVTSLGLRSSGERDVVQLGKKSTSPTLLLRQLGTLELHPLTCEQQNMLHSGIHLIELRSVRLQLCKYGVAVFRQGICDRADLRK